MKTQIFFALATLLLAQILHAKEEKPRPQPDPKLKACAKKIFVQASKVKFNKLPKCYDPKKLSEAKRHLQVVLKFLNQLPSECRHPNKTSVTGCVETTGQRLKKESTSLQSAIVNGLNAIIDGAHGCIGSVVNLFDNLDQYVLAGCPDKPTKPTKPTKG